MARSFPHPLALFSLVAHAESAEAVIRDPANIHFVATMPDGKLGLDVGHILSKAASNGTLVTIGRNSDIIVRGRHISKLQCSFEMDMSTGIIMFYDRSHGQTSQVFGQNSEPFELGRVRKIVVHEGLNEVIGMGGRKCDSIQFELRWHKNPHETMTLVRNRAGVCHLEDHPHLARTFDPIDTALPSRVGTRVHTPAVTQSRMRHRQLGLPLGRGQFATVYKTIDVDSGQLLAVKIITQPPETHDQEKWKQSLHYALKREVEILSRIHHPHIVDYITSQGWNGPVTEIFMGLKDGTLQSLLSSEGCPSPVRTGETCFMHMLKALDFLSTEGIIHRDLKPENILFVRLPGTLPCGDEYLFQLGDFGLSNRVISAKTHAGTPLYMAPEVYYKGRQSSAADIWSLFVTIMWVLDVRGFREKSQKFEGYPQVSAVVQDASSPSGALSAICEMGRVDPDKRASAAQMLIKCFDGEGLSTPRQKIKALPSDPRPAPGRAQAEVHPKKRIGVKRERNMTSAARSSTRATRAGHPYILPKAGKRSTDQDHAAADDPLHQGHAQLPLYPLFSRNHNAKRKESCEAD